MEMQANLYESPRKEINERKYRSADESCICCARPLSPGEKLSVHMSTDWMAMRNTIVTEADAEAHGLTSQGYFSIGNSCAKKMDKNFIHGLRK